jgi:predicted dehydrogenase
MAATARRQPVGIAIIGAGKVSDYHHVPAIALDPRAKLVGVCDQDRELANRKQKEWGASRASNDATELISDPGVHAVIIATPNFTHAPLVLAASRAGKHIMCEKPLGLNAQEVREMYVAARDAGIVHMTAFTYRFSPAMRYLKHLLRSETLGTPRHFRSQRFLDWPETSWGWRQYKDKAGAGNLFDMMIHRIDFALDLLGPLKRICGAVAQFARRESTEGGQRCSPSDVDDWSAMIGEFESGATGIWEGTTLAKGYGRNGFGHEWAEINGSEASAVYQLHLPNQILFGKTGQDLAITEVPGEYLKPAGSPRELGQGEPATVFRYDLVWEFVSAIVEKRPAVPSFYDGLNAQIIADAVLEAYQGRSWVDVSLAPR